jgi:hypothetical protein
MNDLHFAFYGAEPDGMDPTVSRSTLLGDLSAKAGVALALGHCVDELFNEYSLPLFVNNTLTGRTVLFCHQITVDACRAFHIDHQSIDYKQDLPGLPTFSRKAPSFRWGMDSEARKAGPGF